jgi:small subunit ribosomal protein S9
MMADEDTPDKPVDAETPAEETPQHAVPSEEATEIAGSVEDAALEAAEEAIEAGGETPPEPPTVEPGGEGHAVPSEGALEIAGVAEDAPLEALQEAEDKVAVEAAVAEDAEGSGESGADAPKAAKPAVPGAHLEVDIVPEGADPLGRQQQGYEDPYAVEGDESEPAPVAEGDEQGEETLSEPIATAAIDLAADARYRATGKRKTAIARVTLKPGKGTYLINGRTLEQHFPRDTLQRNIRQPLETVGYQEKMDVVARLHGGGISAQAGALRHGVSRALLEADPNLRGELKRRGFLTRDSRAKERKKAGLKKARKKPQFSKR